MSAPGEEGAGRLVSEYLRWEEDAPALGLFEAARIIAHPHHLAGSDEVHVARLYLPLLVPQPHRAATPFEVSEHEEVVRVRVSLRQSARGELPAEPDDTHERHPRQRVVGIDRRTILPTAYHPCCTQAHSPSLCSLSSPTAQNLQQQFALRVHRRRSCSLCRRTICLLVGGSSRRQHTQGS